MITFDGPNKLVILDSTSVTVATLWSRWVDWFVTSDNSKYLPAFRNVGGDPISDVKNLGITYFIINGWKIRPMEANHRLTVEGNLFTDPAGASAFVPTVGAFNVTIEMSVSNLSDVTTVSGGGSTDPQLVADAVWNNIIPNSPTSGTWAHLLKKVLTVGKYLGLK
jgi:hypothetical protein